LNLASWITPGWESRVSIGRALKKLKSCIGSDYELTSIGIAREVASVLDEGGTLKVTAGDGVAADGGDDGGVGQGGLGADDGVGDVVVDGL
jgi:hypothetical protein